MSRGNAKEAAADFDFGRLRQAVMMPTSLDDASLNTEGPYAYRDLDDCLARIADYAIETKRFSVIAYMGHL